MESNIAGVESSTGMGLVLHWLGSAIVGTLVVWTIAVACMALSEREAHKHTLHIPASKSSKSSSAVNKGGSVMDQKGVEIVMSGMLDIMSSIVAGPFIGAFVGILCIKTARPILYTSVCCAIISIVFYYVMVVTLPPVVKDKDAAHSH